MVFQVRPDSPVPIYEQIAAHIVFGIAVGDPEPGSLVPSVRDLAGQLIVNPNTVARSYQELERLGILEARRGLGMEVTAKAPLLCASRRLEIIRQRLVHAIREAVVSGLTAEDVHSLVEEEWTRANGRARRRGREERT